MAAYGIWVWFGGADPMATIEILSGDFERDTTRIRYSEAGRPYLRLRSNDGHVEDLFLESEVVGAAEAGEANICARRKADAAPVQEKRLFVVLLRGGRKFVARGDFDAMIQFETAPLPADQRRERLARLQAARSADTVTVSGPAAWFAPGFLARLLPGR